VQITKQQGKEKLAELVAKFEAEIAAGRIHEYNEEATKTAFIQPFLKQVLGWDVANRDEVSPEENVSRNRVDYGLKIQGQTKLFIEAKPPRADLDKYIQQAVGYGYNKKSVPFVLLTDFEDMKLFDVTIKPDPRNPKKGLKIDLNWQEYHAQFDRIWLLSKESVTNGDLEKLLLVKPKQRVPVDKAILDDLKIWREKLAKDIFKNNQQLFHSDDRAKDADYLKEITQRILDRIMFMRSCEDRKLIHRTSLHDIFADRTETVGTSTMVFLAEEFRHYNIIFDSDLFRPQDWEKDLAIDFKVMNEIIVETYNPYQFDVIPLDVLGNIYEQYLGYTIRLTDHQVKYELKPDIRKAGGVYYTPEYIVDYIVKNTVGKLIQELPANRFLSFRGKRGISSKTKKLRILDPACGSGSFLIRAYEEMLNYYKAQKIAQTKTKKKQSLRFINPSPLTGEGKGEGEKVFIQDHLMQKEEAKPVLTIEEKSAILREHIYGVDIDEQAVEVTKLSLMLKMLEGEFGIIPGRNILPMLDKNIRGGNSLISGDTLELKKYFGDDWYNVKAFNWNEEFRKIMVDEGGFDAVIGNPPWGGDIDKITHYIEEHYPHSTQGYRDTCKLFVDKGLCLTRRLGIAGMIVPSALMFQPRYIDVRRLIKKYHILFLWNVGDKVFSPKVAAPSCVFVLKKESPQSHSFVASMDTSFIKDNIERAKITSDPVYRTILQSIYDKTTMEVFVTYYREQNKKEVTLKEILDCKDCGIKYQRVGVGMEEKGKSDLASRLYYEGKRKSSKDRKVIIGADLNKNGWFLDYAHERYFRGDYKRILKENEIVYFNEEIFNLPKKIIWRQTSDRIRATIIGAGWFSNTLQAGILLNPAYDLRYVLGLLNSKFINFIYMETVKERGRIFPQVKLGKVRELPFRTINFSNTSDMTYYDNLIALVDVMLDLNKKFHSAKGSDKNQIQRQIEKTNREIDDLVYKLYGITDEERKIIEGE
jgi:adenine-specific DNA-methyltransferase